MGVEVLKLYFVTMVKILKECASAHILFVRRLRFALSPVRMIQQWM